MDIFGIVTSALPSADNANAALLMQWPILVPSFEMKWMTNSGRADFMLFKLYENRTVIGCEC